MQKKLIKKILTALETENNEAKKIALNKIVPIDTNAECPTNFQFPAMCDCTVCEKLGINYEAEYLLGQIDAAGEQIETARAALTDTTVTDQKWFSEQYLRVAIRYMIHVPGTTVYQIMDTCPLITKLHTPSLSYTTVAEQLAIMILTADAATQPILSGIIDDWEGTLEDLQAAAETLAAI